MSQKTNCLKCGVLILETTATKTNGLCMPCKGGYRESMEAERQRAREERELDRTDPFRIHWRLLVERVCNLPNGFELLSEAEKLYFAVSELIGEVFNGGFEQYFFNASGSHYADTERGLTALGAVRALELLHQAKDVLFPASTVPTDTQLRRRAVSEQTEAEPTARLNAKLDGLDKQFWADSEGLDLRLQAFAYEHGLVPREPTRQ